LYPLLLCLLLLVTLVSRSKRVESRSVKLFLDLRGNSSGPPSYSKES
jgi:hypothetical protein